MTVDRGVKPAFSNESLLEAYGASEGDVARLAEKLKTNTGNKQVFDETLAELKRLSEFRSEILGVQNQFRSVIDKYFPGKEHSAAVQKVQASTEHKHWARNADKYIDNPRPIVGLALLEKGSNGRFVYQSLRELGNTILQAKYKGDHTARSDAGRHVYHDVLDLVEPILGIAARRRPKNMATLLKKELPRRIPNEVWKEYYSKIKSDYGHLSPVKFARVVLLRLHPEDKVKELLDQVNSSTKTPKERSSVKFGPGNIAPLDELTLCNRITLDNSLTALSRVFGGRDLLKVAEANGYVCPKGTIQECLQENREKMAELRNNQIIDDKEGQLSSQRVQMAIRKMALSRRGWHMLNSDYHAFKFMYSLIAEIGNDKGKVENIIEALFPDKVYRVDSKASFFILPTGGEH